MCIQGDLPRGDELAQRAEQWARRFGAGRQAQRLMLSTTIDDYWAGRWDQLLPAIDWALSGPDGRPRAVRTLTPNLIRGRIRLANGELDQALEDAVVCMELARTTSQGGEDSDYQWWDPARSFAARVLVRLGRHDEAEPLVDGLLASVGGRYLNPGAGIDLAMAMAALGRSPAMLTERQPHPSAWLEATLAFVAGDPAGAAVVFARIGSKPDEADAHLAAARMLHERGDAAGAVGHLDAAAAFYDRVGATAYLAETVRLRRGRPGLAP